MESTAVPASFWDSAAYPGAIAGMDKQAVQDGQYLASYYASDPKLNSSYPYPVTCEALSLFKLIRLFLSSLPLNRYLVLQVAI